MTLDVIVGLVIFAVFAGAIIWKMKKDRSSTNQGGSGGSPREPRDEQTHK